MTPPPTHSDKHTQSKPTIFMKGFTWHFEKFYQQFFIEIIFCVRFWKNKSQQLFYPPSGLCWAPPCCLHYATNRSSLKIGLIAIDKRQCRRGHESPLSGIEFPEKGDAVDVSPGRPEIPSIDEDTITMAHCGAPERSSSRPPTVKARVT